MPKLLHDRLIDFAAATLAAADTMPRTFSGRQVADQLARAGSSPAGNYAEARDAISDKEYAFKVQLCVKELREAMTWIQLARRRGFVNADYESLEKECSELTAISVTCVKKAKARMTDRAPETSRPRRAGR